MAVKIFQQKASAGLEKAPVGIQGLDEITCGGFPRGRPILVCGGPGSGKTMLGLEFLGQMRRVQARVRAPCERQDLRLGGRRQPAPRGPAPVPVDPGRASLLS